MNMYKKNKSEKEEKKMYTKYQQHQQQHQEIQNNSKHTKYNNLLTMSSVIHTNGGIGGCLATSKDNMNCSHNNNNNNNNQNKIYSCSNNTTTTTPTVAAPTTTSTTTKAVATFTTLTQCAAAINNCSATLSNNNCRQLPFTSTNLFQLLCLVTVCTMCYYNSTQGALVFDDISAIRDNKDLRPSTPLRQIFLNDFWGTPMRKEQSHKSYRPLTVLTFRINYWLHELQPYGYHAVNVILHTLVCVLWRRVSRLLVMHCTLSDKLAQRCSFLSSLLFAVHPIHTEAVTGVVGRAELLSSLFFLCAFISYARSVNIGFLSSVVNRKSSQKTMKTNWFSLCMIFSSCLLASMLCKEQGITIAGICIAYELFVVQSVYPMQLWYSLLNLFEEKRLINGGGDSSNSTPTNKANVSQDNANIPITSVASTTTTTTTTTIITPTTTSFYYSSPRTVIWTSCVLKRLGFLVFITVALLVGRVYVMGSQLPVFTRFDNPASAAETPIRQLTFSYLIYLNIWLLLFPCNLCCDWTMGTVPLIDGLTDSRNVFTLLTFMFLAAMIFHACVVQNFQHSRMLLMCLAWSLLPFLPASNLFFPVGFVVAERILYMPSMGFSLLIAYGYERLKRKADVYGYFWPSILKTSLVALLLSHAIRTHQRNADWKNEYTLFMSGVHVNDRNAKLFNNVGHALENEGRFNEALAYFQQAVNIQPDDIGAHINVGRTYNNLKHYAKAEAAYLKAKSLFPRIKPGESYQARIAPNHLNVFINLANLIARNQTRLEEADYLYRQAISMRADYVQAYINRGDILMKLNRTIQAQEVYEKALLYDSENADIYYNLGVVFLEQGKSAQANVYFNKALELYPEHEQALINSAILLQEIGGPEARQLSRERLLKVLSKSGDNEKVFFNLGMLAMDELDFEAAEHYFKRAIHLKANFRSALFNLALLLADTNRPLEAVPFLNELIRHHPDHVKGLLLLGDIYINHMKDLDAAETCYRSILKYEPRNTQGLHNLCVVFVERKHLAKAQTCLRYAHRLAPNEEYILRHLQIVETRLQKISKLPDNSPEKLLAFVHNPKEYPMPSPIDQQEQFDISSTSFSKLNQSKSPTTIHNS
uniref:Protein O-mannosyl-transferase TMTC3 n=1 Tax=Glossina brevipalpis TaxID=37001 RepID=A0A1A9W3N0_9MUSC